MPLYRRFMFSFTGQTSEFVYFLRSCCFNCSCVWDQYAFIFISRRIHTQNHSTAVRLFCYAHNFVYYPPQFSLVKLFTADRFTINRERKTLTLIFSFILCILVQEFKTQPIFHSFFRILIHVLLFYPFVWTKLSFDCGTKRSSMS